MTSVFLVTFLVGFGLTLISALFGAMHVGGDAGHADLGHGHFGHGGDLGHAGDLSHGDMGHGHGDMAQHQSQLSSISPINFQTLMAALMGFGGVGYLLTRLGLLGLLLAIPAAVVSAIFTGWLVLKFQRLLVKGERPMAPTSWVGVVGTLSVPIREGGTGELVYSMNDVRQVVAARSLDGSAIGRDEEVVVLKHENGIAYVQRWRGFMTQGS